MTVRHCPQPAEELAATGIRARAIDPYSATPVDTAALTAAARRLVDGE